ncbi:nose resistant to fluoxetine protein 6-like isoform X2 [Athalia rosae]|nr:nose resistant to fluoxetine protein 6-like isoform X2 [Athalia rosae]
MLDLLTNIAEAAGLSNWTHGNSVPYEWIWCVPSTCTYAEVLEKIDISLDALRVEGRIDMHVTMTESSCHTAITDTRKLDVADWLYISLLIFFAAIVVVSTTIDLRMQKKYQEKRKDMKQMVLTSFSFYTNGKSLLNTKGRGDAIACLNGLRFISICWIIFGHGYYLQVMGVQLDLTHIPVMHEDWSSFLVLNGNIVTDTFFLLSGLLLAYTKYSQKQRNPGITLNLFELYVRRYLRLTPAYAMVIGFYATIYYKFGTGPKWTEVIGTNRDYCRDNWWTNLLYVNNLVNPETMCMSQTWYLAVDMQLVWISPIFLYPMLKFSRAIVFWAILGVGFFIAVAIPFIISYANELTGTMIYYREQAAVAQVFIDIYIKTYARAGPYIVGLGLGYLLSKSKSMSIKIPKVYAILGWLIALVFIGTSVFGPRRMYFEDHVYNRYEASFYAAFHRNVFVMGVGWIIFACVHGIAGPVNTLLSWTGWIPLGKLSYSAYLTHYLILYYNSGTVRTPGYLTTYKVVHTFFGNLVLVLGISLITTMVFEMPFMVLDSAMRGNKRRQSDCKAGGGVSQTARLENPNEVYRTIDNSVSSVSQMYTDIVDISKMEDGSYVANNEPNSGSYVNQLENSEKNENLYTYIVGSTIGSPSLDRKFEAQSSCGAANNSTEDCYEPPRAVTINTVEDNTLSIPATGLVNRAYQA